MKTGIGFFGYLLCMILSGCSPATRSSYMDSGYTKEQLEAMGVNTEHLFVFTEERATYNGRSFSIDIPVDSLIGVFGPCERILYGDEYNKGYDHYLWDEIGFAALVSPEKTVMELSLHWDYMPKEEEYDYDDTDPVPAKFFKGKMLLNGVPLDNTSDYAAYCNNKDVQERLLEMARQKGIVRNFHKVLYPYHANQGSLHRYEYWNHKLYFFDYTAFEDDTFFSYKVKTATRTGRMHEFRMQYDVYTNPNFTDIF
ncbi:hypothetical protein [Alistipes sp.]|uniref:DUF7738 domain-containing protein n=1 Tax=Alistipes sp. TaxID=1872444 RepID=UPI0025B94495|nr:hypothetical protein [Alistipes sp.]